MFRRQDVPVDGYSPPLVPPDLDVTIHAIDKRCELGSEQEDVDPTEGRYLVDGIDHGLLKGTGTEVSNHVTIDVDRGTALKREE